MAFDLKKAYASGEFSDLTIIAIGEGDNREFKVHKLVLLNSSEPLKTLIGDKSEVQLLESGDIVDRILGFIYGLKFEVIVPKDVEDAEGEILRFVETCAAADKYQIPGLAKHITRGVRAAMPELPDKVKLTVASLLCGQDLRGILAHDFIESAMVANTVAQKPDPIPEKRLGKEDKAVV